MTKIVKKINIKTLVDDIKNKIQEVTFKLPFIALDSGDQFLNMLQNNYPDVCSKQIIPDENLYVFFEKNKKPAFNDIVSLYLDFVQIDPDTINKNESFSFFNNQNKIVHLKAEEIIGLIEMKKWNSKNTKLSNSSKKIDLNNGYTPEYDLTKYNARTLIIPKNTHTNMQFLAGFIANDDVDFYAHWCSEYRRGNKKYHVGYDPFDSSGSRKTSTYDFSLVETLPNLVDLCTENNCTKIMNFVFNDKLSPFWELKKEVKYPHNITDVFGDLQYGWTGKNTQALEILIKNKIWDVDMLSENILPLQVVKNVVTHFFNQEDIKSILEFRKVLCFNDGYQKPTQDTMKKCGYEEAWDIFEAALEKTALSKNIKPKEVVKRRVKVL